VQAFFDAILTIEVGDDIRALFWEDNWLVGCSIKTLDSILRAAISPRIRLALCDGLSVVSGMT
jgi:hypothetical protein